MIKKSLLTPKNQSHYSMIFVFPFKVCWGCQQQQFKDWILKRWSHDQGFQRLKQQVQNVCEWYSNMRTHLSLKLHVGLSP